MGSVIAEALSEKGCNIILTWRSSRTAVPAEPQWLTRRKIWTALILYCAVFWGMVGYAIYDIFGR